ncbi:hypothetical protein ACSBR2_038749 [Camellia fascicularis]
MPRVNDDIKDDASSRLHPQSPLLQKTWTRVEIMEVIFWIASVAFILYYGDQHSNFIYLMWYDNQIRRIPLYLGMVGVGLNVFFFLYTSMLPSWTSNEKLDFSNCSSCSWILLVLDCFVANLELLFPASCVIHGNDGTFPLWHVNGINFVIDGISCNRLDAN